MLLRKIPASKQGLTRVNPEYSLERLKLKLQYFGNLI